MAKSKAIMMKDGNYKFSLRYYLLYFVVLVILWKPTTFGRGQSTKALPNKKTHCYNLS